MAARVRAGCGARRGGVGPGAFGIRLRGAPRGPGLRGCRGLRLAPRLLLLPRTTSGTFLPYVTKPSVARPLPAPRASRPLSAARCRLRSHPRDAQLRLCSLHQRQRPVSSRGRPRGRDVLQGDGRSAETLRGDLCWGLDCGCSSSEWWIFEFLWSTGNLDSVSNVKLLNVAKALLFLDWS